MLPKPHQQALFHALQIASSTYPSASQDPAACRKMKATSWKHPPSQTSDDRGPVHQHQNRLETCFLAARETLSKLFAAPRPIAYQSVERMEHRPIASYR